MTFEKDADGTIRMLGLPILKAGTWKNLTFTREHLAKIAKHFSAIKEKYGLRLKVGHGKQPDDAHEWPSLGDGTKMYVGGDGTLMADFKRVPRMIAQLIQKGAFREVSPEVYFDVNYNGTVYPHIVMAASLLGEHPKAVRDLPNLDTLKGINALYAAEANEIDFESAGAVLALSDPMIVSPETDNKKENQMSDELVKTLQGQVQELKSEQEKEAAKLQAAEEKATEAEANVAKLTAENEDLTAKLKARDEADEKRETEEFDGKKAALKASYEKTLEKTHKDKADEMVDAATPETFESVKGFVESLPKSGVFKEISKEEGKPADGEKGKDEKPKTMTLQGKEYEIGNQDLAEKVQKFADEHKISYVEAMDKLSERGEI
jgi:outer membrane murein-binding lipoprotein Lpp